MAVQQVVKMINFFPTKFRAQRRSAGPSIPAGYRVYAIGDVHGRLDLVDELLHRIELDRQARGQAKTVIVFLGDLIDRGPASAQVIERLRTYSPHGARLVFLVGNHEEVLLRILRGESQYLRDWLRFGGAECAKSYGINPASLKRGVERAVDSLRNSIPDNHLSFLQKFVDTFRIGSYLFVHAGIRPGVKLAEQSQTDLRWIRDPFLDNDGDHGFVVVHGHTIGDDVQIRANRIGLDTGAYYSGVLTALGLQGRERWFIQTGDAAEVADVVASEKVS
jgi:serine/threonine protein phosphatase 1